ncbi:MAG: hypothetical protein GTO45_01420 [Candidatus Aminicenantes bacterium]|nr:hypothetical protein [Candidatus Aminicenantes bacterium]NIN16726.1 hypothetical protein [Candidatus Aminicenantes bacterium]NIN40582.1 hypothetical protein [Candidatus Aminicenantes bacterium]NIN83403.1 hypothetical protein [Candidatus Aminicenantes bacterium]NIO79243.1 hypothetical protein [Candidatus Aminicenantes bacterium]
MNHGKKFLTAALASLVLILVGNINIQGFVCINNIVEVFGDEEGSGKQQIESYVISGASSFLQAHSYVNLLLNEYELSGTQAFNFNNALEYTESAISLLESARNRYVSAKTLGAGLGYNQQKIDLFKSFDYDGFIEANNLNKDIAKEVKKYLIAGDITGIYRKAADDITGILDTLYTVKEILKSSVKPDITLFWKLLQQYSQGALFGNYATLIGTAVLDKQIR